MALRISGEMCGSIGGGIMEHKLVEYARSLLQAGQTQPILKHQYHSKVAPQNQSGMICSGQQTVAMYFLQETDLPVIEKILSAAKNRQPGFLQLTEKGLKFMPDRGQLKRITFSSQNDSVWQYKEKISARDAIYIIGGGHVA